MLKEFVKAEVPEEEVLKEKLKEERLRLSASQMKIKEAGLPVMVLFEGWNAAGKGAVIGKVIRNIDPRFFKVATMDRQPSSEEKRSRKPENSDSLTPAGWRKWYPEF